MFIYIYLKDTLFIQLLLACSIRIKRAMCNAHQQTTNRATLIYTYIQEG